MVKVEIDLPEVALKWFHVLTDIYGEGRCDTVSDYLRKILLEDLASELEGNAEAIALCLVKASGILPILEENKRAMVHSVLKELPQDPEDLQLVCQRIVKVLDEEV